MNPTVASKNVVTTNVTGSFGLRPDTKPSHRVKANDPTKPRIKRRVDAFLKLIRVTMPGRSRFTHLHVLKALLQSFGFVNNLAAHLSSNIRNSLFYSKDLEA